MQRNIISAIKYIESFIVDRYYNFLWQFLKSNGVGLNKFKREIEVVVSLTSFPGRIGIVHKTIRTILLQHGIKPDRIELWLANDQFPDKIIPKALSELEKYGLSICWCHDIKSYKKLIPSILKHENIIIVTCDDDVYYKRDWLFKLYKSYLLFKFF